MKDKLKSCPYCGDEAKMVKRMNELYDIGCVTFDCFNDKCLYANCKQCIDGYEFKEDAIKAWNRRSQ